MRDEILQQRAKSYVWEKEKFLILPDLSIEKADRARTYFVVANNFDLIC